MKKSEIIVHIHRPVLTEEERARRMECIRYAAVQVLLDARRADRNGRRRSAWNSRRTDNPNRWPTNTKQYIGLGAARFH